MIRAVSGIALVAAITLTACGGGDDEGLADTSWVVATLTDDTGATTAPLPDTELTAHFTADGIDGDAGCNRYFGSYTTEGDGFAAGPLGATRRLCEPAATMDQEFAFLEILGSADRWLRDGDKLQLFSEDTQLVEFVLASD